MRPAVSMERQSDIIGSIYDCAIDPTNWEPVLETICAEFAFASAILGVLRVADQLPICQVSVGVEPDWLARIPDYGPEILEIWGGPERLNSYPVGEPIVNSVAVDRTRIAKLQYVQEWVSRGFIDAVAIIIARDAEILGSLGLNRHGTAGEIRDTELTGLRLLGPHLRRAVTIGNLFDMKKIEAATFASLFESFSFGVLLVDKGLVVIHANREAEAMLAARHPIETQGGVLAARTTAATAALQRAVQQAATNEAMMGQSGIAIPVPGEESKPCVLHVLPVTRGERRRGLSQRAAAAVFVTPSSTQPSMPREALALIYDLTPAEARVFELICAGETQIEIAEALRIARSTVKTHLLRVFEKTGCGRQVDLVKLSARLAMPA